MAGRKPGCTPFDFNDADMAEIVGLACGLTVAECDETCTAVLWTACTALTRMRSQAGRAKAVDVCSELKLQAGPVPNPDPPDPSFRVPDFRRSCELLCRILEGETSDPTGGAFRLHRHDCLPAWAAGLEPSALIGSFFFYNAGAGLRRRRRWL